MASKPMLEFTSFPPRAVEKPRKRRRAVKTPKILKVRCVAITGHWGQHHAHPSLETESQIRNGELEIAKGAKWVSPQFPDNPEVETRYKRGRRQRPLDLGQQLFPDLQPFQTCQRRKLNLSLKRKEGCARTRIWKRCGTVSTSQHVSLFPSAPSIPRATEQESLPASVPNPPPAHSAGCHLPSFHSNIHSSDSKSDNTDDLHNRAFERGSHTTDSEDAPVPSADEGSVSMDTSSDTTYLEDECSSLDGDMLKTVRDSVERCSTVDEHREKNDNVAHSEIESRNCHGNTKQIAHTFDEDSTEEDSLSLLQVPSRTSDDPYPLTQLTRDDTPSPIGTEQSFVEGECGTRHDTDLGQTSSYIHVPSLPLTPLAPTVSNPQATEPSLNAERIQNASSSCHQRDTHGISCFVNQSGVRSSFNHHDLAGIMANICVGSYQGSSDDSTHLSESSHTMPSSVDLPILECRKLKINSDSVHGRLNKASEPSHYQHHQNSTATSPSPQSVYDDFQGVQDVIQDSVDSTNLPSLIGLEENQSINISAGDSSIRERDTQTVCDLQRFQPSSFSTPFQSTDESSNTSGVHSNLPSNQTEWKSWRHGNGNDGDAVMDGSSTRLDSRRVLNYSPTGDTTPSQRPTAMHACSTHKSILKKRSTSMSLNCCDGLTASTGKVISKCVTFNLSCNSSCSYDESPVLAEDTPVHLWCSVGSLPPNRDEDEINERVMDSEDACTAGSCGEVEESMVHENNSNWQQGGHCCLDDMCILAMDTPVHMWASPTINFIDDTFNCF